MSKRKQQNPPIVDIMIGISRLVMFILNILFVLFRFTYYLIIYKVNKYKAKTNIGFFKTYFDKGNFGEFLLYLKCKKHTKAENILVNTYLEHNGNTETTEIDVIAVNNYGIFIYEMKNYSGDIIGSNVYYDGKWKQRLGRKTYEFYNPFKQNFAHVEAFKNIVGVTANVNSVVVFGNRCKLKDVQFKHGDRLVRLSDIYEDMNFRIMERVFSDDEVTEIVNKINSVKLVNDDVRDKHIKEVKVLQEK